MIEIKYKLERGSAIISIDGSLVSETINALEDSVETILDNPMIHSLIFDFQNIKFMSSSGVAEFVAIYKTLTPQKRQMYFCNIDEKIAKVMRLTGIDTYIKIFNSVPEAVKFSLGEN